MAARARRKAEDERGASVDARISNAKVTCRSAASALSTLSVSIGAVRPDTLRQDLPPLCESLEARLKELRALIPG